MSLFMIYLLGNAWRYTPAIRIFGKQLRTTRSVGGDMGQRLRCAKQDLILEPLHVDLQQVYDQTFRGLVIQPADAYVDRCRRCGAGYRTGQFGTGFVQRVQVSRGKHVQGSGACTLAESALDDGDARRAGKQISKRGRSCRRRLETKDLLRMQY